MRAQQRLIRAASIALPAALLLGTAHAEGGLPGSPQALPAPLQAEGNAAPAAADAAVRVPVEPGGAAVSPFAPGAATAQPARPAKRDTGGPGLPGLALTAVVALAGAGALGWLALLALR